MRTLLAAILLVATLLAPGTSVQAQVPPPPPILECDAEVCDPDICDIPWMCYVCHAAAGQPCAPGPCDLMDPCPVPPCVEDLSSVCEVCPDGGCTISVCDDVPGSPCDPMCLSTSCLPSPPCDSAEECWDNIQWGCSTMEHPFGGLVGKTLDLASTELWLACAAVVQTYYATGDAIGNAEDATAEQIQATLDLFSSSSPFLVTPLVDYAGWLVTTTVTEGGDQFALACILALGYQPACVSFFAPGPAPSHACLGPMPPSGGVVGAVLGYTASAVASACGYGEAVADQTGATADAYVDQLGHFLLPVKYYVTGTGYRVQEAAVAEAELVADHATYLEGSADAMVDAACEYATGGC